MKNNILFLFLICIVVSCSKDQIVQKTDLVLNNNTTTLGFSPECYDTIIDATNSNNLHDQIGVWHNEALDYAATVVDVTDVSDEDLFEAIQDYFLNESISSRFRTFLQNQDTITPFLNETYLEEGLSFEDYVQDFTIGTDYTERDFLRNLDTIVLRDTYNSYQDLVNEVKTFEDNFINNYTESDSLKYFGQLSILRHSLKYWIEAKENECHPYHDVLYPPSSIADESIVESRFDPLWMLRLIVDVTVWDDCLSNGGLGAQDYFEAAENCLPDAIYSSARAFEPGLGGN